MKKLVALVLAAMLLTPGCSTKAPEATGGMKAGTYKASAAGFHGDITLEVTVDAEKITDIQVIEHSETEGIGAAALPELVTKVLDSQSIGIDGVSGATVTSNGFKAAMEDALTQAGADMDKMTKSAESSSATKEEVTLDADIVVVGGGAAGLTAALSSQQNGNNVILLEKTGVVGGASAMAGAGTMATGSQPMPGMVRTRWISGSTSRRASGMRPLRKPRARPQAAASANPPATRRRLWNRWPQRVPE